MTLLMLGALVFLFPFYYMVIGALQTKRDPSLSGAIPWPSNLTLNNFLDINGAINLGRSLLNSGIFT
ncbi:MAG TPA: carbohydrate ABC transporter permease, partial [Aeromicrobium sp.]|nr:carbohydrate ABC transporter permease [Aeromicrobium sp.]